MSFEKSAEASAAVERLKHRYSNITEDGVSRGLRFKPRSNDVFVVTSPKCGTTWMQQIVHQLRSGGDMSFDGISDVVPFIEFAYDTEIDLEAEHNYQPRCYKTHAWYPGCPKGAKYIVIYREPCATFYSYFNFHKSWAFQPEELSLHEYVKDFLLAKDVPKGKEFASYFVHLLSWWEHRNDSNVLFLFFEDMKDDLESVVRRVAAFVGIQDEKRIKKAVEMSSFEFMKKNEGKFSDAPLALRYANKASAHGKDADVRLSQARLHSKVATGSATKGRELMDEKTKEIIQAKWLEVVGKQTGFQEYNDLRTAFKKEQMDKN